MSSQPLPNVIWVLSDQHRRQAMSCAGDPNLNTPNLDRLAARGVRLTNAVSGAPWCTPFRAALLTGQYPHQVGCPSTPSRLDPSHPTIAQPLKAAGYHTAWVGKWHLGGSNLDSDYIPEELRGGFDYWMGFESGNDQYNWLIYGNDHAEPREQQQYQTDQLTDLLIEHLQQHTRENPGQPFFAALSVQPPHDPYVAPSEYQQRHNPAQIKLRPNVPPVPWVTEIARQELAGYYAMIENLDHNLGRLRDAMIELGIGTNTRLMYFSDHGDCHGSHAAIRKSQPWEESIGIPFITGLCRGGPIHAPPVTRDVVLNHLDIAPTTLGYCGVAPPESMTGFDYSHVMENDPDAPAPEHAYLQQITLKRYPQGIDQVWRGVVTRDGWKLICMPGQCWLMFNLNDDPYEQANLAFNTRFAAQRERLLNLLAQSIADTGDDFPLPISPSS